MQTWEHPSRCVDTRGQNTHRTTQAFADLRRTTGDLHSAFSVFRFYSVYWDVHTWDLQILAHKRWNEVTEPQVVSKAQFSDHYDLSSSSQILVCKTLNSQAPDEGIIRDPIYWHWLFAICSFLSLPSKINTLIKIFRGGWFKVAYRK